MDKTVFIQSIVDNCYILAQLFPLGTEQSSILLSPKDRSPFIIKQGSYSRDTSSIYVALCALSILGLYIHHQNAIVKLSIDDHSDVFKQDATFRLIFGH